ncbi:MAG: 2-C-methyl-D-erythritol 2,4-cyclodiphosphate synthase [Acidobacteriota bacterium]|nr:2-C-methyl-D-erythritol 2,4-cyclodiphosphate synthase [Acidobacteriota bacterium]MDQ5872010.1 2-C-methyl-D-erythritol 2,4-cyclodiphosphate synthase [Acidobacteriota bacterium]
MRVGIGFDAHPLVAGRPLRLGGVEIPHPSGLAGHSDGDVLLHAIADAILGAAGLGSLGEYFPDDSDAWRGADSSVLLGRAAAAARENGYRVGNVDAVVVTESPRFAPHALRIRARVAEILETAAARVSVRGTSSNGLGFPGRGEGIAAVAVVLLEGVGEGSAEEP